MRPSLLKDLDDALRQANTDNEVKVIILEGAGDAFCAGFDFSGGLEHFEAITEENYDPGMGGEPGLRPVTHAPPSKRP